MPWNEKDAFLIKALADILRMKYIDILREEMSGVYLVRASAGLKKIPYERAELQIMIPCAPENTDSLIQAAINELVVIQNQGVDPASIQKVRETQKRAMEVNLQKNNYWLNESK